MTERTVLVGRPGHFISHLSFSVFFLRLSSRRLDIN